MAKNRTDLKALRNLIAEADTLLITTTLPEGRSQRAHELLHSAIALADELLAVVGDGLRLGVVTAQLEALAEAAVDGRLESVVVRFAVQRVALDGTPVVAAAGFLNS